MRENERENFFALSKILTVYKQNSVKYNKTPDILKNIGCFYGRG